MRFFDAFAGVGGFHVGIHNAWLNSKERSNNGGLLPGVDDSDGDGRRSNPSCVGYSEIDKYAIKVYEYQFGGECENCRLARERERNSGTSGRQETLDSERTRLPQAVRDNDDTKNERSKSDRTTCEHAPKNFGDITKIKADELPDFDCLVGGFPCQAFSIAGKRKGFEDTRGTLFFDLARILRAKQPMYGVFENVKGLVNHDKGQTLDVILEKLQELGYYCNWEIYNSKDFGVPQNRERVYLVCQNLRGLTNIGQSKTITSSERLIQSYLFQLLLNNLSEVKKLQEHESKDSVLGYLILREINRSQKSSESENTSAGITTGMAESKFQLRGEEAWQNIVTWLSNELDVDLSEPNTSTISTAIKKITPSTTYTFSQMQNLIWLAIVVLRQSQKSLWSEVLSDLTVIQEGTKYARINHKTEEAIVTESGTVHLSHVYKDQHDKFIKRHLRGTPRPEVFPIESDHGETSNEVTSKGQLVDLTRREPTSYRERTDGRAGTLDANYYKGLANQERPGVVQLNQPTHSNDRVYASDGISPTLNTMQGGNRQPFVKVPEATKKGYAEATTGQAINLSVPNSKTRRGRVSDIAPTLDTGMQLHTLTEDVRIRRLTPIECERLQGFPDQHTAFGKDGEVISDTQRYKMCGNAVSVPVVEAVFRRILNG